MSLGIGILTVSDRCSRGESEDKAGENLAQIIQQRAEKTIFADKKVVLHRACVPDDLWAIRDKLKHWADEDKMGVVFTVGGTGFSSRDVTPEATKKVIEKEAPGIVHQIISKSLEVTPLAMLSRLSAGIRGQTLIINFPGSKKAAEECFDFVSPALGHALDLIRNDQSSVANTHSVLQGHTCPHQSQSSPASSPTVDLGSVAGRDRQSPFPMISVREAQEIVFSECDFISTETVFFSEALGKVLAEDVYAKEPLPPFPASIKDGYAVHSADGQGLRPVTSTSSFAGADPTTFVLSPGQCTRINTGGPVPNGADAVVQVEDTELVKTSDDGKEEVLIRILKAPTPGLDIRDVGSDIGLGTLVVSKDTLLGAPELGLLATVGAIEVNVVSPPKVSLLSTGNELRDPECVPLPPGTIRDSNRTVLKALLKENSIRFHDCGIAFDEPDELLVKVKEGLTFGDILVTTGGVSMGDRDILRQILTQGFGAKIHFARVNIKPGKPTTFATLIFEGKKKLVIGLPGNPVSATVTAQLYLLPACRKLSGHFRPLPEVIRAKMTSEVKRLDPRPEYHRVWLSWRKGESVADAHPVSGSQCSSRLMSCSSANGFVILPGRSDKVTEVKVGTELDAIVIGALRKEA